MATKGKGSTVEAELLKATKLSVNDGESGADFRARICEAVSKLDDAVFGKLSQAAQNWFNDSADLVNDGKEALEFPAGDAAPAEEKEEKKEEKKADKKDEKKEEKKAEEKKASGKKEDAKPAEKTKDKGANESETKKSDGAKAKSGKKESTKTKEKDVATKKKASGKKADAKPVKKAAGKAATKPAAKKEKGETMATRVRKIVVAKADISFEDVCKKLGEDHEIGSHAWNIYNHAKCVMEIVNEK